jgi:membrane protein DedA with SNARE-associated domain
VFFIYDFSAAAFSVPVLVYSAWYFGGQIDRVVKYTRQTEHGILIVLGIALIVVLIKTWRRRKRREALLVSGSGGAPP